MSEEFIMNNFLLSGPALVLVSRRNKGNKRNLSLRSYAQPVPQALYIISFISFISAGHKDLWDLCDIKHKRFFLRPFGSKRQSRAQTTPNPS
jgi:hypothetical protein